MIENRFPTSGLSAEYGDIVVSNVVDSVFVEVKHLGDLILSEKYSPDLQGKITISGIGELAILYKSTIPFSLSNGVDGGIIQFTIRLTSGIQVIEKIISLYPSVVDFSASLNVDTMKVIPLSRITQKTTGIGRTEFVSFYGGRTVKGYVVKKGLSGDSGSSFYVTVLEDPTLFYLVNVSPAEIARLSNCSVSDIIYYSIYTSSDYAIRFTMDERNYPYKKTFVFRNCFGAQESFTCVGGEKSEKKWTREFGNVDDKQVSISRDLINKFTVNTGYLLSEDLEALEDLLNSDQICLLDEYGFQEVVIMEENFSDNSRQDELKQVEFTYRFSKNNQFKTSYKAFKKPRIFTSEFDKQFD